MAQELELLDCMIGTVKKTLYIANYSLYAYSSNLLSRSASTLWMSALSPSVILQYGLYYDKPSKKCNSQRNKFLHLSTLVSQSVLLHIIRHSIIYYDH